MGVHGNFIPLALSGAHFAFRSTALGLYLLAGRGDLTHEQEATPRATDLSWRARRS